MKINRSVWRHINKHHSVIYHSVSGGKDSLYALLGMMDEPNLKVPIVPLFNNTGMNTKDALQTIENIKQISQGNPFTEVRKLITLHSKTFLGGTRYSTQKPLDILKESFMNLPQAEDLLMEGKYSKKVFPCCYFLKDRPLIQFAKTTDEMALFTRSIRGGESRNRQTYLAELRSNLEYFNFDTKLKRFVFYPLRDTNQKDVDDYLLTTDFWDVKKSGCNICPILVLFNLDTDKNRFNRSINFYNKLRSFKKKSLSIAS